MQISLSIPEELLWIFAILLSVHAVLSVINLVLEWKLRKLKKETDHD